MKKCKPIFLILTLVFLLVSCGGQGTETGLEPETKTFVSKTHGEIGIFPTYEYLGVYESGEGKGIRQYNVWEEPFSGKYLLILQIVPKQGTFPKDLLWVNPKDALFVRGMRAAYDSIASRTYSAMQKLGVEFPACFILAEEVHVAPKEALFRILIVPDAMCTGNDYPSVMEELDRVLIINPLG